MRAGAIVAVVVASAGCEAVFPLRDPPGVDGGGPASDGSPGDAEVDADVPPPPDAACGLTCLGNETPSGFSPCAGGYDYCGTSALDALDIVDVCACGVPRPLLYVLEILPGFADIVLVGDSATVVGLRVNGGAECILPDLLCYIVTATCPGGSAVLRYAGISYSVGTANTFDIMAATCTGDPYATFILP